ncbi:MAG: J domain-containing protein, partial [bacterium]|nr:J domain-containing protein [bacterium]
YLNTALASIIDLVGLDIEICGAWVWVTGETFAHKDTLKAVCFKFAGKKKAWYFRPENWKSKSRGDTTLDDIRDLYGSARPPRPERGRLSANGTPT